MSQALPQSYSTGRVVRIPVAPQSIGDHIRKRRLGLKLLQKDVAEQLGVDKTSVFNWEANTSTPGIRYMPAIIDFLGYDPLPAAKGWGARLVRYRTTLGMTQKETAGRLGVDQGTLARWERGKRDPQGAFWDGWSASCRTRKFRARDEPGSAGHGIVVRRCGFQSGTSVVGGDTSR